MLIIGLLATIYYTDLLRITKVPVLENEHAAIMASPVSLTDSLIGWQDRRS
jgi:hypothetical protein